MRKKKDTTNLTACQHHEFHSDAITTYNGEAFVGMKRSGSQLVLVSIKVWTQTLEQLYYLRRQNMTNQQTFGPSCRFAEALLRLCECLDGYATNSMEVNGKVRGMDCDVGLCTYY